MVFKILKNAFASQNTESRHFHLCSPPYKNLIQVFLITLRFNSIHMTAIKHKKSQVIYTYELTNTQIFICKVMLFYDVCFLMFFYEVFFFFLFALPATMLIQFFTSLNSAGEQFRNNSPSEEKLNSW